MQKRDGLFFRDLRKQMILCDQWMDLLDKISIGAFTIDAHRHITAFNLSVQAITGLKESDVLGKDCREVFSEILCHSGCPFHTDPGDNGSSVWRSATIKMPRT